jgi:DNA-binding MarR family transcriptional regulator
MQTGKPASASSRKLPSAPQAESPLRGCTCARLRRLTRRVTAVYNRALAPTGMRITQYSLLANLRRSGAMPLSALADLLDMDRTTLSRNLRPLADAGWVTVIANREDARVRIVGLTAEGEAQWQVARAQWKRAQQEVNETVGASELAQLHEMLDRCVPLFRPASGSEGEYE